MLMGKNVGVHYPKSLAATVRFWCAPSSDFLSISEWMADDMTWRELDRGRLSINMFIHEKRELATRLLFLVTFLCRLARVDYDRCIMYKLLLVMPVRL